MPVLGDLNGSVDCIVLCEVPTVRGYFENMFLCFLSSSPL